MGKPTRHEIGHALYKTLKEVLDKTSQNVKMRRRFEYAPGSDVPETYASGNPRPLGAAAVSDRRKKYAESIGLKPTYGIGGQTNGQFPSAGKGNGLPYNDTFDIAHEVGHAAATPEGKTLGEYQGWLSHPDRTRRPAEPGDAEYAEDGTDPQEEYEDKLQDYGEGLDHENVANITEQHIDRRAGLDPHMFQSGFREGLLSTDEDASHLHHPKSQEVASTQKGPRGSNYQRGAGMNVPHGGKLAIPADGLREEAKANIKQFDRGARFTPEGRIAPPTGVDAKINARAAAPRLPGQHLFNSIHKAEPNLRHQESLVADQNKLSPKQALHELYVGLKKSIADFEKDCVTLRKAELAKADPAVKVKVKAAEGAKVKVKVKIKPEGDEMEKDAMSDGGAGSQMGSPPVPGAGDMGMAEHEPTEKDEQDLMESEPGVGGDPMCKACGKSEKLCKCDMAEKWAKGELKMEKSLNPVIAARMAANKAKARAAAAPAPAPEPVKKGAMPAGASPDAPGKKIGVLPDDKKSKEQGNTEGSGGEPKPMKKTGIPAVAGAPPAPKAPGAPKLPGMGKPAAAGMPKPGGLPKPPAPAGLPKPPAPAGGMKPPAMGAGQPAMKGEKPMAKNFGVGSVLPASPGAMIPGAPAAGGHIPKPAGGVKTMVERAAARMQPGGAVGQVFHGQPGGHVTAPPIAGGAKPAQGVQTMVERVASRMPQKPAGGSKLPGQHLFAPPPAAHPAAQPAMGKAEKKHRK